jgi:hypothetical protein
MNMKVILSLDGDLVKKVPKIAVDRDTTLTGLIRRYLEEVAVEDSAQGRKHREREALEQSFRKFRFTIGKRNWTREDLHIRS